MWKPCWMTSFYLSFVKRHKSEKSCFGFPPYFTVHIVKIEQHKQTQQLPLVNMCSFYNLLYVFLKEIMETWKRSSFIFSFEDLEWKIVYKSNIYCKKNVLFFILFFQQKQINSTKYIQTFLINEIKNTCWTLKTNMFIISYHCLISNISAIKLQNFSLPYFKRYFEIFPKILFSKVWRVTTKMFYYFLIKNNNCEQWKQKNTLNWSRNVLWYYFH